jgi:hypothetical protein
MEPRSWDGIYLMVFLVKYSIQAKPARKIKVMVLVDGCAYHGTKELGGDLSDGFLVSIPYKNNQ